MQLKQLPFIFFNYINKESYKIHGLKASWIVILLIMGEHVNKSGIRKNWMKTKRQFLKFFT